jgi:CRP-like cAMP-binding protein
LVQNVNAVDAEFVVSGLDESIQASVMASETEALGQVRWLSTLDEALEHVEQTQLNQPSASAEGGAGDPSALSAELMSAFGPVTFDEGAVVMAQDSPSDSMIVVKTGGLTAYRVDESGQRHRMRRFGSGAVVGEIGLITGGTRSAEVIADTDVDALSITVERYGELRRTSPELAFELHEFIMLVQAERVRSLSLSLADALR